MKECEKYEDGRVFYEVGVCYQMGYGSVQNMDESYSYYLKSLLCGYSPACLKCYVFDTVEMNDDVFENNHERFEDVKRRGSKGDGVCLGIYGCCLFHGIFEERKIKRRDVNLLNYHQRREIELERVFLECVIIMDGELRMI